MKAFIRRALCAVGLTGGVVIVGFGLAQAASADTGSGPVTSGQSGILSGNQTGADAKAPVNLSGNQITVIGQRNHTTSAGSSSTGTSSASGSSGSPTTTGQDGGGSGNQTGIGVQAPVNASGNQVTVVGQDNTTHSTSAASSQGSGGSSGSPTTSGQSGIGSGNQTGVGVQAPINVSCNQVTVIGQRNTSQCAGGSSSSAPATGTPTTTGQGGLVAGNQTALGVLLPINVSGNQVTVIGQDNTLGSAGASSTGTGTGTGTSSGGPGSPTTSGASGIGSGNQTGVDVLAPIAATGNQVTVIGQDNTVGSIGGSTTGGSTGGTTGSTSGPVTTGESGILSGNQTGVTVLAPVAATGNQVTAIGQDNTVTSIGGSSTGGSTTGSTTGPVTSGQDGIGSGNQTGVDVLAPVAATGNQVTVIGQDNTVTSTGGTSTGGGTTSTGEATTGAGGVGSGNQTPIDVQAPVDTSGNQVTVIGQDNSTTSTSGSTSGGSTGGVVSPPTSGTVTPPSGGTATTVSGPQGSATPGSSVLPNTGLGGALPWLAAFGLLLLALGSALTRRSRTGGTLAVVRAG